MIAREVIEKFFRDVEARGTSLEREMVWGYFFTDRDPARLERVRVALDAHGYRFVGIYEPTAADDDKTLFLHVERTEQHTPASLFARCETLGGIAASHELESFDGFDVGNVDGSKLY